MFAVAGVGGQTGRAVAESLLRSGERVRVIVRDHSKGQVWQAKGASIAAASLDDAAQLSHALQGVQGAYLLLPPTRSEADVLGTQRTVARAIADAVAKSGIEHVVFLSSIGAQQADGTGPVRALHDAEARLRASQRPVTFLRPSYFLENWAAVLGAVQAQGILPSFIPVDLKVEMNGTADVGDAAARLLRERSRSSVVEMAGPEPVSPRDIAEALGRVRGKSVQPVAVPLDQVVPTFTQAGLSQNAAELFREMYEGFQLGRFVYETNGAPQIRGTRRPEDVLGPMLT